MKLTAKLAVASSLMLLLLAILTDPQRLPSVLLVVPFVLIFIILSAGISYVFGVYGLFKRRRARIGLVGATIPVLLLVLQSLGQLTVRDALAIFILFGVAYFYVSRFGAQTAT
jgi:hypothetical protein